MHILDLIMYFVTCGIIWFLLEKLSNGELTNELGGLVGLLIILIWTIIYIMLFWVGDRNWIDIFHSISKFTLNITL